jgi:MoxR-like ATPase
MDVVAATTAIQELSFERTVTGPDIVAFQKLVRRVPVADEVIRYAVNLARTSRPSENGSPDFVKRWVEYGASVRAAQYLVLGGKARALMAGRYNVSFEDVRALAQPVFRHRILTNFHAESERVSKTRIVDELLAAVPLPRSGM